MLIIDADKLSSIGANEAKDLTGVRVGVPREYFVEELPEEILRVWDQGVKWLLDAGKV